MIRPELKRAVRALTCTVAAAVAGIVVAFALASTSVAAGPARVVPIPGLHPTLATVRLDHHRWLLLRSLELSGIRGMKLRVSCDGCQREPGPIRERRPTAASRDFVGVNWVLSAGRAVSVIVYRRGWIGRYLTVAARLKPRPALLFKRSGCLTPRLKARRCPSGTTVPPPGSGVAVTAPVTPTQPPGTPSTTTTTTTPTTTTPLVAAGAGLAPGETLAAGSYLEAADGQTRLVMQTDGDLVLFGGTTTLWSSDTAGDDGASAEMLPTGNLVVTDGGVIEWSSNTQGFAGAALQMESGAAAILEGVDPVWSTANGYTGDELTSGETLVSGERLQSANGNYELIMQGDGNLVLYQGPVTCVVACTGDALWDSVTEGLLGATVTMGADGNLVISQAGNSVWKAATDGFTGAVLKVQNDGDAVIYDGANVVWSADSGYLGDELLPGETLQPGEELQSPNHTYQLIMQEDGNLVLYQGAVTCDVSCHGDSLWNSGTEPDEGATVTMQTDGNLVISYNGATVYQSGTESNAGAILTVQNDSNLVIYKGATAIWDWESGLI